MIKLYLGTTRMLGVNFMKIQTLRMLILSQAVCLVPGALAAVTINGTPFDSFSMSAAANGDITIKTVPAALAGTIPATLPKSVFDITMTSLPGDGATAIDTIPGPGQEGGFTPINCVATPNDPACPVEPPPPPPGECGTVGADLVFETIPWASIPGKITVTTGKKGAASKFTTSTSTSYKGYFSAVADSASGNLTRRMWFSECPGAAPIVQNYSARGITVNKCDVSGVELKLSWSQENQPAYVTTCKLERNKTYYLNYSQAAFGTGAGPTSTSKIYRGSSRSGTP
jgi:hypothetical protein